MEYNSFTKKILSSYFKNNNNLIILNNKNVKNENISKTKDNLMNFILTIGIYYFKISNNKSVIITKDNKKNYFDNSFIKNYFNILHKYEK